jgi:hypothetical protein
MQRRLILAIKRSNTVRIYFAGSPEIPFNKPKAEAEAMIAAGLAFKYVEPVPVRTPKAHFTVQILPQSKEPYIAASCSGCSNKVQFHGPTAHKTQVFRHCGITDAVPERVADFYAKLRAKWKPAPAAPKVEKLPSIALEHFA